MSAKGEATPSLADRLRESQRLKSTLDDLDSNINQVIPLVETALMGLKLGVPLEVQTDFNQVVEWCQLLAFRKVGQHWRLVVESGEVGEPETWSSTPLLDTPRETKAVMLSEHLPRLVEESAAHLQRKIAGRKQALQQTLQLLVDLDDFRRTEVSPDRASDTKEQKDLTTFLTSIRDGVAAGTSFAPPLVASKVANSAPVEKPASAKNPLLAKLHQLSAERQAAERKKGSSR